MTLSVVSSRTASLFARNLRTTLLAFATFVACALAISAPVAAQDKPNPAPDTVVLSNGDTLHGKFVSVINGTVTFHSSVLGDLQLTWDKIKELHASEPFAVINKNIKIRVGKKLADLPVGTIEVSNNTLTIHAENSQQLAPLPVKDVPFILSQDLLNSKIRHKRSFIQGWAGSASAGATLVTATQNQYTVTGGFSLVKVSPPIDWLRRRARTSLGFTGSYGKIIQPSYFDATGTFVPEVVTKSAIYHAEAERDQYFSERFFTLGQTAFDHNYAQDLDLQEIYGGGFGWTFLKTPKQEGDLKGTVQYEKQLFISDSTQNQNLIGSTFSINYIAHLKLFTFAQNLAFIPSYNNPHAYSATESNTFSFPAYKNLSFTVGTLDSYLNNPPISYPPTVRNSFQFTMGLSYAIKPKQ
ncbi:MAG: DUF481 domain-containing protein [Acidobacteriota bacterium]|nr:DUF481 domain-containing protein [Acidobacteriota bacterium]